MNDNKLTRAEVYNYIDQERNYQALKWDEKPQSLTGFLLIMRNEQEEAEQGWMKSIQSGRNSPLAEILQVVATGVACLERYGVDGLTINTNDIAI